MSKKSVVVSGMGLGLGMLINADQIRKELGITDEEFHVLATDDGREHWQRLFEGVSQNRRRNVSNNYETYTVTTGIYQSLEEAIEAGHYGYCNPDITEHFSLSEGDKKNVEIALIYRDKLEWSQNLIDEMDEEAGYRPATHEELLALGAQHPELQRKFLIIALGAVARVGGSRHVLVLVDWCGVRGLDLRWFDDAWARHCRFAFVRKN